MKRIVFTIFILINILFISRADVNETDSLLLKSIYRQTGGDSWTTSWDTLSAPVNEWHGVTIEGNRVTGIDLSGNNLSGILLLELSQLSALVDFNISNNNIYFFLLDDFPSTIETVNLSNLFLDELPNPETLPTTLNVAGNNLTYEDLDYFRDVPTLLYSGQSLSLTTIEKCRAGVIGGNITLKTSIGGENTTYQWVDIEGADNDVKTINNTSPNYTIEEITSDNIDTYKVLISNPDFPDLDFEYEITIEEAANPVYIPYYPSWHAVAEIEELGIIDTNHHVSISDLGGAKFELSDVTAGSLQLYGLSENHPVVVGPSCFNEYELIESRSDEVTFFSMGKTTWNDTTNQLMVPWGALGLGIEDTTYIMPDLGLTIKNPSYGDTYWDYEDLDIIWSALNIDDDPYLYIEFTFDHENWFDIESGYLESLGDTFTWDIKEGYHGEKAMIRIRKSGGGILGTAGPFEIKSNVPSSLVINKPLPGDTIFGGETYTLEYLGTRLKDHQFANDVINLWYSLDGNKYYLIVKNLATNSTSYEWEVPALDVDEIIIRATEDLEDNFGTRTLKYNASPFYDEVKVKMQTSEPVQLEITGPAEGDTLFDSENPNQITFDTLNLPDDISFELEADYNNGEGWTYLAANPSSPFDWEIPAMNVDSVRLRLRSTNYPVFDYTGYFHLRSDSEIDVVLQYPTGGETFTPGDEVEVEWDIINDTSTTPVAIHVSYDGGSTYSQLVSHVEGSYNWVIPEQQSSEVMLKISLYDDLLDAEDISGQFTILEAEPLLEIKPSTDTNVVSSTYLNIAYKAFQIDSAEISYSADNGSIWNIIASGLTETGTSLYYAWLTPDIDMQDVWVRIIDPSLGLGDTIKNIAIRPEYLNILYPASGDTLVVGTKDTVLYETNSSKELFLQYSVDDGPWQTIDDVFGSTHVFTVPPEWIGSDMYRFKIGTVNSGTTEFADSTGYFTVLKLEEDPDTLQLTYPNGGETWIIGEDTTISWSTNLTAGQYEIQYSSDGGANFNFWLDGNVADGQSRVTIPADWIPGNEYLLNISSAGLSDTSDAVFSVTLPAPAYGTVSGNVNPEDNDANPDAILFTGDFEAIDTVDVINNIYLFEEVHPGEYIIKLIWNTGAEDPVPVYYGNTPLWSKATRFEVIASHDTLVLPGEISIQETEGNQVDNGGDVQGSLNPGDGKKSLQVVVGSTHVYLLNPVDSTLLFADQTDGTGNFSMDNIAPDDYLFWMDIPNTEGYSFSMENTGDVIELNVNISGDGSTEVTETVITSMSNSMGEHTRVYPMPARDELTITSPVSMEKVWLISSSGQVVKAKEINALHADIKVSTIEAGIYILKIKAGKNFYQQKILIIK
jgi:hypothetical protein